MDRIKLILNYIIEALRKIPTDGEVIFEYSVITCFDHKFPAKLKQYWFQLPIIYYRGQIKKIDNCLGVVLSNNPSYYIIRTLQTLNLTHNLFGIEYQSNSMSNNLYLCDIIYCNDISNFGNKNGILYISFNQDLVIKHQLQIYLLIISKLIILEGYPTTNGYQLVKDASDNQLPIYALPTNIYIRDGIWPNLLISEGITPLILNESKEEYT